MLLPLLRSLAKLICVNMKFSFAPLLHWTPLGVSVKWEEQIWCLNMKTIKLKTPAISLYIVCSGPMDPCTF